MAGRAPLGGRVGALAVGEQPLGQGRLAPSAASSRSISRRSRPITAAHSTRARPPTMATTATSPPTTAAEPTRSPRRLGTLEFLRTRELLARFLPAPPVTVLDVGGAAGPPRCRWPPRATRCTSSTRALHVEQASAAPAAHPTRRSPPPSSDTRSAAGRRRQARRRPAAPAALPPHRRGRPHTRPARGAARLRPGGLLAAAAITRFASTLDGVAQGFLLEPGFEATSQRHASHGHRRRTRHPAGSTTATSILTDELEVPSKLRRPASRSPPWWRSRAPLAPRPRPTRSTCG